MSSERLEMRKNMKVLLSAYLGKFRNDVEASYTNEMRVDLKKSVKIIY